LVGYLLKILDLAGGVENGALLGNPLQLAGQVKVELVELHGLAERLFARLGGRLERCHGPSQLITVPDNVVPVKMTLGCKQKELALCKEIYIHIKKNNT
jgi:hypothetical protein